MSAVYVHGAKHLLNASRKLIIEIINGHDHSVIVDPFCGGGTFVAASKASVANVNIMGESIPYTNEICATFPQAQFSVSHMDAIQFLHETIRSDDSKALLFLDPPRPNSAHYTDGWKPIDQIHLLQEALEWSGPVVYCGYGRGTPIFQGGGWDTEAPYLPRPIMSLMENQDPIDCLFDDMFISHRKAL